MTGCSREAGFTLVELLVTLAILSLMVVYGWSAVADLYRFQGRLHALEAQAEADAAARTLREELSGMRIVFTRDSNNAAQLMFDGQPHELSFVTVANGDRETGGLYGVHIYLESDGTLVSERSLLRGDTQMPRRKVTLLRNVKDVVFRYYTQPTAASPDTQVLQWAAKTQLPEAVSISVELSAGHDLHWQTAPILIAASGT